MRSKDPFRFVSHPHAAKPAVSRLPRLGLAGLGTQSKLGGHKRESGKAGELPYPRGDVTAFQGDSVVGMREEEIEAVRLAALQQEVKKCNRIRPTRHRDNGSAGAET